MLPNAKKPDFLDSVADDMGEAGSKDYGADMSEEGDEGDSEEAGQDRIMAAKMVGKAMGLPDVDAAKLADALAAFVKAC